MKTESVIDKLQIEVVDLKEKLRKSENEVERLGRLVDSLTREIDRMERSNYSDDDDYWKKAIDFFNLFV